MTNSSTVTEVSRRFALSRQWMRSLCVVNDKLLILPFENPCRWFGTRKGMMILSVVDTHLFFSYWPSHTCRDYFATLVSGGSNVMIHRVSRWDGKVSLFTDALLYDKLKTYLLHHRQTSQSIFRQQKCVPHARDSFRRCNPLVSMTDWIPFECCSHPS